MALQITPRLDMATLVGLVASLVLVAWVVMLGDNLHSFLDIPALLIVIGGTLTVVLTSFTSADLSRTGVLVIRAFQQPNVFPRDLALELLRLALKGRQVGLLALQQEAAQARLPFLRQGLSLAVDGAPVEVLERLLVSDTASLMERHTRALAVLQRAAEVAPAMGLVGTLIGLVQMLGNLSDPSSIGPAMAIAIVGTFYGALLAYTVFTPLAVKLEGTVGSEMLQRKLIISGVLALVRQDNPRQLELALNALLPPLQRVRVEDAPK
jgi:chemotaxis protein MotA